MTEHSVDSCHNPTADWLIALGLCLLTLAVIVPFLSSPGVTWDEASPGFPLAKKHAHWLSNLGSLDQPFSKATIDTYWETRSDHPSLPRMIAGISYSLFSPMVDEITALRIPSAVSFSLLIASVYLFLRLFLGRAASLAGSLSLLLMPRVFGHAHIFSLDLPMMCWWFWAAITGYLVVIGRLKPIWFGLIYAIAFTTKLHSLFLPFPLLAWAILLGVVCHRSERDYWIRLIKAIAWAICLTPILYIGLQPWLWYETWPRIYKRFFDLANKTPISTFFMGELYGRGTPWYYPFVMLLYTIPGFMILLSIAGLMWPLSNRSRSTWSQALFKNDGMHLFVFFCFLTPVMLVVLPLINAYDGCRLFLPCFPFLACAIGMGYHVIATGFKSKVSPTILHGALMALLIVPPLIGIIKIHPHHLAYYNSVTGGTSGAQLSMESTYWCDSLTQDFITKINRAVPTGKTITPASMSFEVYDYYYQRGWLEPELAINNGDYFLLQFRQGMFREWEWQMAIRLEPIVAQQAGGATLYALYANPTKQ